MNRTETLQKYTQVFQVASPPEIQAVTRHLALHDLFFLLVFVLGRKDVNRDWLFDRCKEIQKSPDSHLDLWFRDGYKALGIDTPIWTTQGWKRHGDLKIGDWVFSERGTPTPIIAITPHTDKADCYRIEFDDGYSIVCSGDHLWPLEKKSSRRLDGNYRCYGDDLLLNTRSISVWKPGVDHVLRSKLACPLQGSTKPKIDPYVLGTWLGDGTSSDGSITVSDEDIELLHHIEKCGFSVGKDICPSKYGCGKYTIYKLLSLLNACGLKNNKHIPSWCFSMSVEDRLSLLQGLMDTDGGNQGNHGEVFTQVNKNIAEGVYFLALSLGLKPTLNHYNNSYSGFYHVSFMTDIHLPVYRLQRKASKSVFREPRCRGSRRFIKNISKVSPVSVSCIQVANPTGQYLAEKALIPTHNSTIITFAKTIQDILLNPEVTVGIFSCTRPIAKAFLRQIKRELEGNSKLKTLFPEILYANPQKSSPKWALDINTPIWTTQGWKRHGELQIGDQIFGSKGQIITVIGNSGVMKGVPCREVALRDGAQIIASCDHLWPIQCKQSARWAETPEVKLFTTDELPIKTKKHRIPLTPILQSPSKKLPLSPYILGLFLGDGTAGTNIISMASEDEAHTLAQIHLAGFEYYVHRKKPEDNFSMYGVRGLKEALTPLGCLREKHIPKDYLLGNPEERLALLQGLMDSDGTCKGKSRSRCAGSCTFCNTNVDLASGAYFLATSLGLKPCIYCYPTPHKPVFHVHFVGLKSIPPFRNPRKLVRCKEARFEGGRYIKSVHKIKSVPVNCIKVDASDGLYLAGYSLVQTHNSEDDGLIVKRKSNPREATVEAWGMVDGMPTSHHFSLMIYDDVVTKEYVSTPEMITKTNTAWELSRNLATVGGKTRYIGTRYHYNDTYTLILERKAAIPRIYPATDTGKPDGIPLLWTREVLMEKIKDMGVATAAAQLFQDPRTDSLSGFNIDDLRYWSPEHYTSLNIYILVDPANTKGKRSDYTVFVIMGLGEDENYYVIDIIRDRLSLTEKANTLFKLHRSFRPLAIGYEQYGLQADIQHYEDRMARENYRFQITPLGGKVKKEERVSGLQPLTGAHRLYIPDHCIHKDYQGAQVDVTRSTVEEFRLFPFSPHDDILDAMSRILDPNFITARPRPSTQSGKLQETTDSAFDPFGDFDA